MNGFVNYEASKFRFFIINNIICCCCFFIPATKKPHKWRIVVIQINRRQNEKQRTIKLRKNWTHATNDRPTTTYTHTRYTNDSERRSTTLPTPTLNDKDDDDVEKRSSQTNVDAEPNARGSRKKINNDIVQTYTPYSSNVLSSQIGCTERVSFYSDIGLPKIFLWIYEQ